MQVRVGHVSLQHGDPAPQHTQDLTKIFMRAWERNYKWLTGTESGPGAGNTGQELVRIGQANGFKLWVPEQQALNAPAARTDCWIAVRSDFIKGRMTRRYDHVIDGADHLRARGVRIPKDMKWGPKGVVSVAFNTEQLGRIGVGSAHYLTHARGPRSMFWKWNEELAGEVCSWARKTARGKDLGFYGGDQNMADNKNSEPQGDTFFGGPLTSAADELHAWQNTGHGAIDVIASYDRDLRVTAKNFTVFDDNQFFLHTDHFLCEAVYDIKPLP